MRQNKSLRTALFVLLAAAGCGRAEPASRPAPQSSTAAAPARSSRPAPAGAPSASETPAASASQAVPDAAAPSAIASAAAAPSAEPAPEPPKDELRPPELMGPDGKPLAQTEDKPSLESPWFKAGVRALFRAIVEDDPNLAKPFFFPLAAYRQVKDVASPDRDWQHRLIGNFVRDVHAHHEKLGPHPERAQFVGIDVPESRMRWMKPRSEGNRVPYYRVTHSKLRYRRADGKPSWLEVTSFISWRGEWYLVHLDGFK